MFPRLIPRALRTITGTEVKTAPQVEVRTLFTPRGSAGLLNTPAPLLQRWCCQRPMVLPGHWWGGQAWVLGTWLAAGECGGSPFIPSYSHVQGPQPGPEVSPSRAWLRAQGSAAALMMAVSHVCVGPGTFPRAFKCIILLEAHLRQGLKAHWKTTHLLTPEWGGS